MQRADPWLYGCSVPQDQAPENVSGGACINIAQDWKDEGAMLAGFTADLNRAFCFNNWYLPGAWIVDPHACSGGIDTHGDRIVGGAQYFLATEYPSATCAPHYNYAVNNWVRNRPVFCLLGTYFDGNNCVPNTIIPDKEGLNKTPPRRQGI